MNNMTDQEWIKKIGGDIEKYGFSYRHRELNQDILMCASVYVLYGYHKQYLTCDEGKLAEINTDDILQELSNRMQPLQMVQPGYLSVIYSLISEKGYIFYEQNYHGVLLKLFDMYGVSRNDYAVRIITPKEINDLLSFWIEKEGCKSVYDPFCGIASITHSLSQKEEKYHFEGGEINPLTALYAHVFLDSLNLNPEQVVCEDSLQHWNQNQFDAVVTCCPASIVRKNNKMRSLSYWFEEELLHKSFEENHANLFMVVLSGTDSVSDKYSSYYTDFLDTVIELPSNMLYEMLDGPIVLHIFKRNRKAGAPVRMLRLRAYSVKSEYYDTQAFDFSRFLQLDLDHNSEDCTLVSREDWKDSHYNIIPIIYQPFHPSLKFGQRFLKLEDLLSVQQTEIGVCENQMSKQAFSRNFIHILLHANQYRNHNNEEKSELQAEEICTQQGKYLLEHNSNDKPLMYALKTDCKKFRLPCSATIYRINEALVMPEFLTMMILRDSVIQYWQVSIKHCLSLPVIVDSLEIQENIVSRIKQKYNEDARAEREADEKRLGIKQNISDLEHMLGAPQHKIKQIINHLEQITPDAKNYAATVQALKDNIEYVNRLIEFNHSSIDSDSFNLKEGDFSSFIQQYVSGWRNYGGDYFRVTVVDELENNRTVEYDKLRMTVLLDAILGNAVRHGFHKQAKETNLVEISLNAVQYEDQAYALLKIANNGDPMPNGFDLKDYISRGRFSAKSGRSGLGGYHVYQVTKGHHGYLYLDKNYKWNMIVEILLPLDAYKIKELKEYEHGKECI